MKIAILYRIPNRPLSLRFRFFLPLDTAPPRSLHVHAPLPFKHFLCKPVFLVDPFDMPA
jgi:hypothetical protein